MHKFFLLLLVSLCLYSAEQTSQSELVNVRSQIMNPQTYLSSHKYDAVGEVLSKLDPVSFRKALEKKIKNEGIENVKGTIFLTGVEMKNESRAEAQARNIANSLGIPEGQLEIRALSVPSEHLDKVMPGILNGMWEKTKYFFPSMKRHFEYPTWGEIKSGLISTAGIEFFNVLYVYNSFNLLDAHLVVATHTAVLVAYTVFKKYMINWLLAPGTSNVQLFFKQVLLSFPFVLNYNIFGQFTEIMNFYMQYGALDMLVALPSELTKFFTTQGFTLLLQTIFYSVVVTSTFRSWENDIDSTALKAAKEAANKTDGALVKETRPTLFKKLGELKAEIGFSDDELTKKSESAFDLIQSYEKSQNPSISTKELNTYKDMTPLKYMVSKISHSARAVNNWNLLPILALDAVVITMASTNSMPLYELGHFTLNSGHVLLGALTLAGTAVGNPRLLDHTLTPFEQVAKAIAHTKKNCMSIFSKLLPNK